IDYQQKKYERSFKQINKAIELNPLQAQSYHLRAQIQLQNGEIKQARSDYQKALELDPAYLNAHYNLALLYDIYLQEIALAIEHYSIYLSLLGEKDEAMQDWINHLKGTLENG
ncbi:MAG: tetratricopeptide repeat protein, partial [Gammaproteobacteria bacterium]|nr:tetratricopeptide repeat protein [Gammaproteobacteria bacterium]